MNGARKKPRMPYKEYTNRAMFRQKRTLNVQLPFQTRKGDLLPVFGAGNVCLKFGITV